MAVIDISGATIFSQGSAGKVHVAAHRALDTGRLAEGHRVLGRWLQDREGSGRRWAHLQWHMLHFEVSAGQWTKARERFDAHILPAVQAGHAPVDGPAGLWWLRLTAEDSPSLPWEILRESALRALVRPAEPHTVLYHLLALAGAGDPESIDRWLRDRGPLAVDPLVRAACALRAVAAGECLRARTRLDRCLPELPQLGGSRAQNALFRELRERAAACAVEGAAGGLSNAA